MICPKCGNEIGEGKMYCEKCGEEIQFVPDYEPEIENSISNVLSDVADQIDPTRVTSDSEEVETEPEETEELKTVDILTESSELVSGSVDKEMAFISRKQFVGILGFLVGIIIILIFLFSLYVTKDNSEGYQMDQGDSFFAQKEYIEALNYYEKAYRLNPEDISPLYRAAECYKMLDDDNRAIDIYKLIISKDVHQDEAWDAVISLMAAKGDYSQINKYISDFGNDKQKYDYSQYISDPPLFSYEEGEYNEMIGIELSCNGDGDIYFTLDGTEPGSDCTPYTNPIYLRNGEYTIKAVCVNEFGICSESVAKTYSIVTDAPEAPEVSLPEGHYNVPQIINVEVPSDVIVYYTVDGSDPGLNSAIYTEPISIPVGDSWFRFVAASKSGNLSEEVSRKYILTVDTVVSQEDAIAIVYNRQYEMGRFTDTEGSVEGSEGKYMYTYSEMRYVQNKTLYFISEYYQEGTIRMLTGNVLAVDVYDGTLYQAVALDDGKYKLNSFGQ